MQPAVTPNRAAAGMAVPGMGGALGQAGMTQSASKMNMAAGQKPAGAAAQPGQEEGGLLGGITGGLTSGIGGLAGGVTGKLGDLTGSATGAAGGILNSGKGLFKKFGF